jgi:hypothetical protein
VSGEPPLPIVIPDPQAMLVKCPFCEHEMEFTGFFPLPSGAWECEDEPSQYPCCYECGHQFQVARFQIVPIAEPPADG